MKKTEKKLNENDLIVLYDTLKANSFCCGH